MTLEPLSADEAGYNAGATHKAIVTFRDLTTAGTSQAINLATVAAEMGARCLRSELKSSFVFSDAAITTCTMSVDDTTSGAAGLMAAGVVAEAATEIGSKPGVAAPTSWGTGYTAADTITATFTATGGNVNTATKGEIWIYLEIRDGRT